MSLWIPKIRSYWLNAVVLVANFFNVRNIHWRSFCIISSLGSEEKKRKVLVILDAPSVSHPFALTWPTWNSGLFTVIGKKFHASQFVKSVRHTEAKIRHIYDSACTYEQKACELALDHWRSFAQFCLLNFSEWLGLLFLIHDLCWFDLWIWNLYHPEYSHSIFRRV